VRALLPPDLPVLAPDRPGYGSNPARATGLAGNADRMAAELRSTGGPGIVVGHSWAGGVALALARRHPELVEGLVLVSSLGPGAILLVDRILAAPVVGPALVASAFRLGAPLARRRLRRITTDEREVAQILEANPRGRVWRSFLVEQRAMLTELPGLVAGLPGIDVPTMVLAGERDHLVPLNTARALASALPAAQLRILAGAGHDLPLEAPEAVASAIVELVGRVGIVGEDGAGPG
jgi:pimeloyl-ACP methyl ester carboxylesterase